MPGSATRPALIGGLLAAAVALSACGGSGPSARPPDTAAPAPATPAAETPTPPAPTEIPGSSNPSPPASPGTFETAWGEAWDALPAGFPMPPNAVPADPGDPIGGPVSGAFVVDISPDDAAAFEQAGLATAGYSTEALSGPFEDGSLVIDSVGADPDCRVQTRIRALGGTTMITVLYGAACPLD